MIAWPQYGYVNGGYVRLYNMLRPSQKKGLWPRQKPTGIKSKKARNISGNAMPMMDG
jgi:hypothetical protein